MDGFQTFLLVVLILLAINYLGTVFLDRVLNTNDNVAASAIATIEGFENSSSEADSAKGTILANDDLYDDFYASVYDKLAQGIERSAGKVALIMSHWTKNGLQPKDMKILDAGCGTGITTLAFKKMGAGGLIGLDQSESMLRHARNVTMPATTLNEKEKATIEWRKGDLLNPSALAGSEVNCAVLLYFTVYYVKDLDALFRNMGFWVAPGGNLVVEVVNKYKFDPILDSASPFAGFSIQKYVDKRQTKSKVVFDKFEYAAEFRLMDESPNGQAEFREAFSFKDGSRRKQRHTLNMPEIKKIVSAATFAGWTYKSYVDITMLGFEYGYLLFFTH
jgi:ubiquinone/menaquinone biosynthesis C-methylase UbiE